MTSKLTFALAAGVAALALTGPASAQFQERTIRVSNGINADHPVGNGLAKMNQCVGEKSGGKMKLQGFWGNALGGDLQATQSLRSGTLEMVITSTSPLVGILPDLGVFDLPFLVANAKEADAVLDGSFGKYIADKLPAVGLVNLAYWENGFRNLTNSRKPIAKAEDFSGVKLRVMQNNIFLDTFKTMGANAVPMAFGEVFTALETKAIDGQENPFVTIDTSKFYEVQNTSRSRTTPTRPSWCSTRSSSSTSSRPRSRRRSRIARPWAATSSARSAASSPTSRSPSSSSPACRSPS
jgi:tripartite ATP-independent transporter DctP family solute receptor